MAKEAKRPPMPKAKKPKENKETKETKETAPKENQPVAPVVEFKNDKVVHPPVHLVDGDKKPQEKKREPVSPVAEFMIQSFYNKEIGQWVVTVAEFPELSAMGQNRLALIEEVETRLEDELEILKRRGEPLPEPIHLKEYPQKLEVNVSAHLYRRLDLLSRYERANLETLVSELLTSAVDRRYYENGRSNGRPQAQAHQSGHSSQNQRPQQHRHGGSGNHVSSGNLRNRSYHDSMGGQDNFLEYVRNLEKGGGGNKWRK